MQKRMLRREDEVKKAVCKVCDSATIEYTGSAKGEYVCTMCEEYSKEVGKKRVNTWKLTKGEFIDSYS